MYKPLGTKVTFNMRLRPKISPGGLYLPGKDERSVIGDVVDVGDEVKYIKPGDKVFIGAYDMKALPDGSFMMDEMNILAVLEGDDDDQIEA